MSSSRVHLPVPRISMSTVNSGLRAGAPQVLYQENPVAALSVMGVHRSQCDRQLGTCYHDSDRGMHPSLAHATETSDFSSCGRTTNIEQLLVRCSQVCASFDIRILRQYISTASAEELRLSVLIDQLRFAISSAEHRLADLTGFNQFRRNDRGKFRRDNAFRNVTDFVETVKSPPKRSQVVEEKPLIVNEREIKSVRTSPSRREEKSSTRPSRYYEKGSNDRVVKLKLSNPVTKPTVTVEQSKPVRKPVRSISIGDRSNTAKGADKVSDVSSSSNVVTNVAVKASVSNAADLRGGFFIRADCVDDRARDILAKLDPIYTSDGRLFFDRKHKRYVKTLTKPARTNLVPESTTKTLSNVNDVNNTASASSVKAKTFETFNASEPDVADYDWAYDIMNETRRQVYGGFITDLGKRMKAFSIPNYEEHAVHIAGVVASRERLSIDAKVPELQPNEKLVDYFCRLADVISCEDLFAIALEVCYRSGPYTCDDVVNCYLVYLKDKVKHENV